MRILALATMVLLATVGALAYSRALESTARDASLPVSLRVEAARKATHVAPWSKQAHVTLAVAEADSLLEQGRVDEAYRLLLPLSRTVHGDALFRETYQRVVSLKTPLDSRKAHQQHAREQPGGALDDSDVIK